MNGFPLKALRHLFLAMLLFAMASCNQSFKKSSDISKTPPVDIGDGDPTDDNEDIPPADDVPEDASLVATTTGEPTSPSAQTDLNIFIAGTDVTFYKYKIGAGGSVDCTVIDDYSIAISIGVPIANSVTSIPDGPVVLCILGMNATGQQSLALPTEVTWTQDLSP
ncbi:MAG: hypothetical protein AB7O96_04390 [Pseudobdellovibrionaceae bacterium]